jgi:glutamate-1-semialdehyde aminotransferase
MPNTVRFNPEYPTIAESERWLSRARGLVPALTQTLAKGPGQHVRGVAPVYAARGKGSHVWDVDGNEYIDWQMGIGPLVLGYANEAVDEAVRRQLADGITFSLVHPLEVEVAEWVRDVVPNAEMVRFSKTGCDVTTAAVRLARAFTGRSKVLCCGYHGWHDWFIATTDRRAGIPGAVGDLTATFAYNDLASVREALDADTACVILEPLVFEEPKDGFLQELKRLCKDNGTLLVFDEMWTGFRIAMGGAQERYDVKADLACFSKAVANGMPLSLLTGRADVMKLLDRDVFFFTTFGGEALSLAAAKATLAELRAKAVPAHLERQGTKLRDGVRAIAGGLGIDYVTVSGLPARTMVSFSATGAARDALPLEMKSLAQQELLKAGILWGGFHNVALAHDDADVAHTLAAWKTTLETVRRAVAAGRVREELRGEPVEAVFRKTSGFHTKPKASDAKAGPR